MTLCKRCVKTRCLSQDSFPSNLLLPDHLHCIWTLPAGEADFSSRRHAIKARFARAIPAGEQLSPWRQNKGERGIWQRRFREQVIRDLNLKDTIGGMRCAFPPYELRQATLKRELAAFVFARNHAKTTINRRLTSIDARIKLKHLYPSISH